MTAPDLIPREVAHGKPNFLPSLLARSLGSEIDRIDAARFTHAR